MNYFSIKICTKKDCFVRKEKKHVSIEVFNAVICWEKFGLRNPLEQQLCCFMDISWFLIWGLLDIELMTYPFIKLVKCATFRSFCIDGDKSKQLGLFCSRLGETDYCIICHFPSLNHLSALRYHLAGWEEAGCGYLIH